MKLSLLRVFGLGALLGVSASVTTSCSPPPAQCSASTCANGCCSNGQCVGGTAPTACGARGNMCVSCPTGFSCMTGSCVPTNQGGGFATGGGSVTGGGSTAGGAAAGGAAAGGAAAGGRAGGSAAGGAAAGGSAAGGSAAGGSAAGGSAAGGSAAGGSAAGGSAAGGSAAGGSAAGGSAAGGSAAGGSAAGGSAAGGSAAGGSAGGDAGGSAAGGSAAGGSAAGGSAAGGSAAGGSAAGGSAGGGSSTNPADYNFFVVRVGPSVALPDAGNVLADGGISLTANAAIVTLEEHNLMSGMLLRTVPVSMGGGPSTFVLTANSTTEGTLTRSADGRYLVLGGYLLPVGTLGVSNLTATPRVVARLGLSGGMPVLDTSTSFTDGFVTNSFRSACTNDGTGYWGTGSGTTSNGGTRYAVHGAMGTSTSIYVASSNTRACDIYGGELWVSTGSSSAIPTDGGGSRIYSLGALPTSAVTTPTFLPGVGNTTPGSFALFDNNPNVAGLDLLYSTDTSSGGIRKYTFDGMIWTEVTQFALGLNVADGGTTGATCLQMAAQKIGADFYVLCVTSDVNAGASGNVTGMGNRVLRYVDVGGAATMSPVGTTVFTSGYFEGLRGVAFSPQ